MFQSRLELLHARQQPRSVSWQFLLALLMLSLGSMACRLEFGLGPDNSVGVQTSPVMAPAGSAAQTVAQAPRSVAASPTPMPSPTPLPSPTATPSPTVTPTPPPLLAPTVVARQQIVLPAEFLVKPTATAVALLPARYPPAQLIVPAIELEVPVQTAGWAVVQQNGEQVSVWDVPENAAGWHQNSALPGHGSNVVLSGHHNLGAEVFRDLVGVEIGDEIVLQADSYRYFYQITDRFIVPELNAPPQQKAQNAQWILPTIDERITLVTCWPYQGNSHRLIVVARPVGFEEL